MSLILEKVDICNFRSIADLTLTLKDNCRILVGINEAGKSNILKALSLLDENKNIENSDLRQFCSDEDYDAEAYIEFKFQFPKEKVKSLKDLILKKFLTTSDDVILGRFNSNRITINTSEKYIGYGYYHIDIREHLKNARYLALPQSMILNSSIKQVNDSCPSDFEVTAKDNKKYKLKSYQFVDESTIKSDIPENYISDITVDQLTSLYRTEVTTFVKDNLPEVIYWKYEDKYLLPSKIKKTEFIANPNICVPLKNMFELAELDDIKTLFDDASKRTRGVRNMLDKVAKSATKHFKETWKEYQNIEFELLENGDYIEPSIKELNAYEMEQRSDGFKRFVTFLLMVSISVKTKKLTNALIIVDEPEISLHPSGAKFLRDELLNVAKNNFVVYSTHSPFMIDKNDISRHYRVIKKDEKTQVLETTQSDYTEEEVLLNALGTSLFEGLKHKNLVFEGWTDKHLFHVATSRIPSKYKELKEILTNIGTAHSKGVKDIRNIAPLLELANKECFVVSDSDKPAKDNQKRFNEDKCYGKWLCYDEIYLARTIITSEDFIKNDIIVKVLKDIAKEFNIAEINSTLLENCPCGKIAIIVKWLNDSKVQDVASIIRKIKETIFTNLKYTHIEDFYFEFLTELTKII